jgi:hypothetical protein
MGIKAAPTHQTSTLKSINSLIEDAGTAPISYAERAKLVYELAAKNSWSRERSMQMLQDPQKLARLL